MDIVTVWFMSWHKFMNDNSSVVCTGNPVAFSECLVPVATTIIVVLKRYIKLLRE